MTPPPNEFHGFYDLPEINSDSFMTPPLNHRKNPAV